MIGSALAPRAHSPGWEPSLRGNMVAASLVVLVAFGGFLVWGYTVHLDSAATASGTVVVDSRRKTVSHLEGGILETLLVQEGDHVAAGAPLARIDGTRARASLDEMGSRRTGLMARVARLQAEQLGSPAINFPAELVREGGDYFTQIERNETLLFGQRRETQRRTLDVHTKQGAVYAADAAAAAAQLAANADQQKLLQNQIGSISALVDKGLATRTQLADLQGKFSELVGAAGELQGAQARAEQARAGTALEYSRAQTTWQSDIADALQAAQIELSGLDQTMAAAADMLRRTVVTAPVAGIVANIKVSTAGGAIGAGQPIMDVIPENDARVIEARMDPRDIDAVQVGAAVRVRLSAYSQTQSPPLEGTLTYLAADQSVDERTSAPFYLVRATVSEKSLASEPGVSLYPGMPADLIILNKPRLAIDYITAPIAKSLYRAFREE